MVWEDLYTHLDTLPHTPSQLEGEGLKFFIFSLQDPFYLSVISFIE